MSYSNDINYHVVHDPEDQSSRDNSSNYSSFNYFYTNYPQQEGYTFPGGYGYYYVLGIDGNRTLVRHDSLTTPTSILGSMCCPCFAVNDPWTESRKRYLNCVLSWSTLISVAQIALFVVCCTLGDFAVFSENPTFGPTADTLVHFGAKDTYLIKHNLELWRFVSSSFLHTGVISLVLNVFALLRLGMYFEREWKWWRFLVVYIVCGVGANLMGCILQPNSISVSSTGAFLGVMAAYLVQLMIQWRTFDPFQRKLQLTQLIIFFALLSVLSLAPFVELSSHLGGIVTGLLLGWAIFDMEVRPYMWVLPSLLLFVYVAGGFTYLFMFDQIILPLL